MRREGSYEASKALLDNFANREITDHMDRLPRDVAGERLHHDIVRLLDEHIARSPQMATIISSGPLIGQFFLRETRLVSFFFGCKLLKWNSNDFHLLVPLI